MRMLLSIIIWLASALLVLAVFLAMLLFAIILYPFDKKRKIVHAQCFWWANMIIGLNPYWKVHVAGLENIDKHKTYVVVANHQSLADIIVLYKTGMQFKWVAKESLFKVPLVGWCLSLAKHIRLSRGDFSSIKKVYREAAVWLRNGISVLFFPEGTRSKTGKMGEFQNGAFKLAIQEKKPILPILINGTSNAIAKGSWMFSSKVFCTLQVLPAIETTTLHGGDFNRLRDMTQAKLEGALK